MKTITTRPVKSASIRCGNRIWEYAQHMPKLTPDFELEILGFEVTLRDGTPVELQITVSRKWRESMFKGKQDSARIFIRTVVEERLQGKEKAQPWRHDFDPLSSSIVGSNRKHNPVLVDSIDFREQDGRSGRIGPSGETPSSPPGLCDDMADPNFKPDETPAMNTDDMDAMMAELTRLCRKSGFTHRQAEYMFMRLAFMLRYMNRENYGPSEGL